MEESKQGNDYDEHGFDEGIEDVEEVDEDLSSPISSIYGIPIKFVIIGAVVILILLFFLVSMVFNSKGDRYNSIEGAAESMPEDVGNAPQVGYNEPIAAPDPVEETQTHSMTLDSLSDEAYETLRKYGYTADEIELAFSWGFNMDALIQASKDLQDEASKESLARVSDTAGEEYKALLASTYLGQPEVIVDDQRGLPVESLVSETVVKTINADYVKCPAKGVQLQLKCKIGNGTYYWYTITPQRWVTLPESGNIVLKLTITYYGDDLYIVEASEADAELDTINASHDLQEVPNGS